MNFVLNLFWFAFTEHEMALVNVAIGLILCCTVIGIPWGRQLFKLARISPRSASMSMYVPEVTKNGGFPPVLVSI